MTTTRNREALAWFDLHSRAKDGLAYDQLDAGQQARVQAELRPSIRRNTYDATTERIVVPDQRGQAIGQVAAHYASLFSADPATHELRKSYAMREDTVPDAAHRRALGAFFFWASWATVTQRPDEAMSYTQNWPYEPLVGNAPTSTTFIWSDTVSSDGRVDRKGSFPFSLNRPRPGAASSAACPSAG